MEVGLCFPPGLSQCGGVEESQMFCSGGACGSDKCPKEADFQVLSWLQVQQCKTIKAFGLICPSPERLIFSSISIRHKYHEDFLPLLCFPFWISVVTKLLLSWCFPIICFFIDPINDGPIFFFFIDKQRLDRADGKKVRNFVLNQKLKQRFWWQQGYC